MNADLRLLKLLLQKDLIKPGVKFKDLIKYDGISEDARGIIKSYFILPQNHTIEIAKKKLITSIKKALSGTKGGLSTIHFIITRRDYADVITLYRKLPAKKLSKIKDYLQASKADTINFTFIEKGTELFNYIDYNDLMRYGFALKLKPEVDRKEVEQNLLKFKRLRDDIGVTNVDMENTDLFKENFCKIYDEIAYNDLTDVEIRDKIKELLRPVSRT